MKNIEKKLRSTGRKPKTQIRLSPNPIKNNSCVLMQGNDYIPLLHRPKYLYKPTRV